MTAALPVIGADVGWPDAEAAGAARTHRLGRRGRLDELVEWLAGIQGSFPPAPPRRPRCVLLGPETESAAELAGSLEVRLRSLELPELATEGFAFGVKAADEEIEAGADLLVLAGRDESNAAAALVSVITGAEPVALLPRGPEATDSQRWIAQAGQLRDVRRRVLTLRARPDELLAALDSALLASAAGFALRAAARRTPVVLDGRSVLAAALLCADEQPRVREWWQVADTSPERAHARAVEHLELRPLLGLGTDGGDGTAGLLAVALLRAAVLTSTRG
jgi:nicotinate-nucleotide--dimethylbenzimidazole phosphoribosyltransferase